jgi:AcrR family transcriptional regulator
MEEPETSDAARWHERTTERSLKSARARAISKADQFMQAAVALLRERGQPDFTVQEVVERSGMSLRSFYHHFASKDELLLAVIEEGVRSHLAYMRTAVQAEEDPRSQLKAFVYSYYGSPDTDDPASRGLSIFHLQLADSRVDEYRTAYKPQVELLVDILTKGRQAGVIRTDLKIEALAQFVTDVLVYGINMRVLGVHVVGSDLTAEEIWALLLPSVAPTAAAQP